MHVYVKSPSGFFDELYSEKHKSANNNYSLNIVTITMMRNLFEYDICFYAC